MAGGKDLIRYDLLVQDALKGVVRKVFPRVKVDGHDAQVLKALDAL